MTLPPPPVTYITLGGLYIKICKVVLLHDCNKVQLQVKNFSQKKKNKNRKIE